MLDIDRLYLKPSEVAAILRLTPSAVYRMAREGRLPSVRFDRSIRVPTAAFKVWLREKEASSLVDKGDSLPPVESIEERYEAFRTRVGMTVDEYLVAWRRCEIEDTAEGADLELEALSLRRWRSDHQGDKVRSIRDGSLAVSG